MRVLIVGVTGAIGRPLVGALRDRGHVVFALARSPNSAREVAALGAEAVIADVLDAIAVKAAITQARPDAVINELTSLPRHYTAAAMAAAADRDRQLRIEGNRNLLAAFGPDTVYYATRLRGAVNGKAKRELDFRPRRLKWLMET
jgi:nucleoside-diphosphate-sugar epimerase